MKMFFAPILLLTPLSFTQADSQVPPPPMPHYMKNHKLTNPPPAPGANKKLQSKNLETPEPSTTSKFLKKKDEAPKIQQKEATVQKPKLKVDVAPIKAPLNEHEDEYVPDETANSSAKNTKEKVTPLPVAEKVEKRVPSSKKSFKAGMHRIKHKCDMYSQPNLGSTPQGSVPEGRKLWIDKHSQDWHKAYKKTGTVYISADCL